jgi:hypothetical protein
MALTILETKSPDLLFSRRGAPAYRGSGAVRAKGVSAKPIAGNIESSGGATAMRVRRTAPSTADKNCAEPGRDRSPRSLGAC